MTPVALNAKEPTSGLPEHLPARSWASAKLPLDPAASTNPSINRENVSFI